MIENNIAIYCETKKDSYLFLEWLVNNTNVQWCDGKCVDLEKDVIDGNRGYVVENNELYFLGKRCNFDVFASFCRINRFIPFKASDIIGKLYDMPSKESLMDFLIGEENV